MFGRGDRNPTLRNWGRLRLSKQSCIAVFGLGRSGLAVARAVTRRGDNVTVVDAKTLEQLAKPDLYHEAIADGIAVHLGWNGRFEGFDTIVSNPAVPRTHPALLQAITEGIDVISEVEFAYRISEAPIVAITGTNGKSTTTVMTYLALRAAGVDAVLCGNIYGSGYPEMTLTKAADHASPDQILVAEISSFQLEWVSRFAPVSAGITTITPDHLDRYDGRFEDYAATKMRIFGGEPSLTRFSVIRANDPVVVAPTNRTRLRFGDPPCEAEVTDAGISVFGKLFERDSLPFTEPHNFANAAMAMLLAHGALVGTGRTVDFDKRVVAGIREFKGLAHRMQEVGIRDGITVINNSMCTNPDAVIQSSRALHGRAHILIGGLNKGLDFAPLGDYLRSSPHNAYLFGSERNRLNDMMDTDFPTVETMQEAFRLSVQNARSGDTIILSPGCASSDQFKDFVDRGNIFIALAKEWLSNDSSMEAV